MHLIVKILLCSAVISFYIAPGLGARILAIEAFPSYSHHMVLYNLWKQLSLNGHHVTVLTTDPENDPTLTNLTEIDLHFSYDIWNNFGVINEIQKGVVKTFESTAVVFAPLLDAQLQHPEIQTMLTNKNEHFDVVIADAIYPGMFAFAARFQCPLIQIASRDASYFTYDNIGNPAHAVLNPECMLPFAEQLTFFERLTSTFTKLMVNYIRDIKLSPKQHVVIEKHFGEGFPRVEDIAQNTSMLFVNADPIFHRVRSSFPNVIQIRDGIHLRPSKPLPKDLKEKLDNATQGFIYFSLGSNIKSRNLRETTRKVLLDTFAELPYLVLWKFEMDDLPGKAENIIISKWFPQQDIFRHPHIKLFITQGGLQSMEEAIYNHIPIIGMPFSTDQPGNIKRMVAKGVGLAVDHATVEKELLKSTILEVIKNPKYRNTAKELGELAKDQPMSGLERAIWWTEYVIRHKGAKHLRSSVLNLPFYQYYLLDVIGFCAIIILTVLYLLTILPKLVFKLIVSFQPTFKVKVQ